jgi:cephalosporin hydroxylase
MKLAIDTETGELRVEESGRARAFRLYSPEAFEELSKTWIRVGWSQKYSYSFSWLGRPIVQLPEDLMRIQEVIYRVKPDIIIETGVAHGGSLVYYASLLTAMGRAGRVIGIDIDIRHHNRAAIERHEMSSRITLLEGSSTSAEIVAAVKRLIEARHSVLAILDSNHAREYVLAELETYAPMVSVGSYIVATDGIMRELYDSPAGRPEWKDDNPYEAARQFAARHPEFSLAQPPWLFNESPLTSNITYWPGAYLRRRA